MNCKETLTTKYGRDADGVSFCPYRICPVGAHIDHQFGKITGFAIDKGISTAYFANENSIIKLTSLQFDKNVEFDLDNIPETKQKDWADYLRGAAKALKSRYDIKKGFCGVIDGSIPIGGLSSSAAVTLSFLSALCKVNDIHPDKKEIINCALEAERKYVGVNCGKLDQYCEVYSGKDMLLYLDTLDDTMELIPVNPAAKPFEIMILFSGIERTLAGSGYNNRVEECKSAAYTLKTYAGIQYGKSENAYLRDVPVEVFEKYKSRLTAEQQKRAEHYFTEFSRTEKAAQYWREGNIDAFGEMIFESGASSIYNYETGSKELKVLYDLMKAEKGVYGGRFSGAGFRGCCMALIDPEYRTAIAEHITDAYIKHFPELKNRFAVFFCSTADGVEL